MRVLSDLSIFKFTYLFIIICNFCSGSSFAGLNAWTGFGPEGGVVRDFAVFPSNPAIIYAATEGGGVFRSNDNGTSWTKIDNGLTSTRVMSIAVDATDSQIVYAGTAYDPTKGLFKTSNGGDTWTRMVSGLTDTYVFAVAAHPTLTDIVYAGTEAGLFKTTNGGLSWSLVYNGDGTTGSNRFRTIEIDPVNNAIVYAGSINGIFKTSNNGLNWDPINVGLTNMQVFSLAIDPQTPLTVYAGTRGGAVSGLFVSTNGGLLWNSGDIQFQNRDVRSIAINSVNPNHVYLSTWGNGVFRTVDAGLTWNAFNTGLDQGIVQSLVFYTQGVSEYLLAGSNGGAYRIDDSAGGWSMVSNGLTNADITSLVLDPQNSSTLYAGTRYRKLFKSHDSGQSWTQASSGINFETVNTVAIDPITTSTIYAIAANGLVYRSLDSAGIWTQVGSGIGNSYELIVNPSVPATLYASQSGGVFVSDNSGAVWTAINEGLPNLQIDALAFDAANSILYCAPFSNDGVFKRGLADSTWVTVGGIGPTYVKDLVVFGSDLYAAGLTGIYKSTNGGLGWTKIFFTSTYDMVVDPVSPNILYAGTFGYGVSKGENTAGVVTWASLNEGLTNPLVQVMVINPNNPDNLYSGTIGGGVFHIEQNIAPIANPGGPYSANRFQIVNFNASASSDADGDSLTYAWNFGDGTGSNSATPSHSYAIAGNYTVTLVVNDGLEDSVAATSGVTVFNQAPTANPGGPYTANRNAIVTFNGSASSDPESDGLSYAWNFGDGSNGTSVNPTHSYADAGNYTVSLVVNDGSVNSSSASTQITINNRAPTANPAGPYTAFKNQTITFNGTLSSDPESDPLTFSWNFGDNTTGTGISPSHSYGNAGTYTVTLVVNDGFIDSVVATAQVTINNRTPTANPGGPYSANRLQQITFNGSGSSDPDNDALSYTWNFGDGSTGTGVTSTHSYTNAGSYSVSLTVNDGTVNSNSVPAQVTINNQVPMANAGGPYTVNRLQILTFNGSGSSDPESDNLTYAWNFGDGSNGAGVSPTHTYTNFGTYNISLVVNDGSDNSQAAVTTVTVNNQTPVADPGGVYNAFRNEMIDFDGSNSSDPEGDTLSYTWSFGDGATGSGSTPTHSYTNLGSYTVTLSVNDGLTTSSTVSTQVTIVNRLPIGNDDNIIVDEGDDVNVDVLFNDSDEDGVLNPSTLVITSPPLNGSLQINPSTGLILYRHDGGETNSDTFTYVVSDNDGGTTQTSSVNITVLAFDDAPEAKHGFIETQMLAPISATLGALDVDSQGLQFAIVDQPTKGSLVLTTTQGGFEYTPNQDQRGRDFFTFRVNDGNTDSNLARVRINIIDPNNGAPTTPELLLPNEGDNAIGTAVTFSWAKAQDPNNDLLAYEIVYCEDSSFETCNPIQVSNVPATAKLQLMQMMGGSGMGLLIIGLVGFRGRTRIWTIIGVLIILLSSLNGCSNAVNETLQNSKNTENQMSYTENNLTASTTYYWKIVADDGNGGLTESTIRTFSTQ